MSRSKRISVTIRKLIIQESIEKPDVPRRLIAVRLQDYIARMGEPVPSEETLIKMISKARTDTSDPLDFPWSLKASIDHSFPIQSTPHLLRAWKVCLALDMPFSIRHAKWAAYLSAVASSTMDLISWSHQYAILEKIHKVLDIPFTSVDLDVSLTSSVPEIRSLAMLGKMKPIQIPGGFILSTPTPVSFSEDAIEAAKEKEYTALSQIAFSSIPYNEALKQTTDNRHVLPPIEELNLSQELIWIYCYWLTCFEKSPKWIQLQHSEVIDNIKELREWLLTLPEIISRISNEMLNLMVVQKKYIRLEEWVFHAELFPPERILKQLGYFSDTTLLSDLPSFIENFPGDWSSLVKRMNTYNTKLNTYANKRKNVLQKEVDNEGTHS